jgi:hypothetical protein
MCDLPVCSSGRSTYGLREPPGTRLPPVFARRFSSGRARSEQRRGRHGVGVPPVRLRLDLGVQVWRWARSSSGLGARCAQYGQGSPSGTLRSSRKARSRRAPSAWYYPQAASPTPRRALGRARPSPPGREGPPAPR